MTELFWFLITAMVVITLHEAGHLWAAIACGISVKRFSIGFGQPIFIRRISLKSQVQPLELALAPIPLGGYVRMLDSREGEVAADQVAQAFDRQPLRRRVAIVAAGPVANLLLAVLLYAGAGWVGTFEAEPVLAAPTAGSLAEGAGLQAGDRVQ